MSRNLPLGVLCALSLWALNSPGASAQSAGTKPMIEEQPEFDIGSGLSYLRWKDPKTGCEYFVSETAKRWYVIGSPVLRSDGKPDCPDVDKK